MCLLCVEVQKQKMTPVEVARAFQEVTEEHLFDAAVVIELQGTEFSQAVIQALHDLDQENAKKS